jgi:hypothetical protein
MKKIILVMVALIAAPAMAEVTISVVNNADCTFDITYAATDADQLNGKSLISGMALNISVDGGATIDSISGYKTDGESTNGSPGYGIYPASITITSGVFVSSGDPVADAGDPGTVGVLGDSAITIELGALYDDDAVLSAAPLATGTLCTLTLGNAGSSHNVTLALEETHRKGVIMEDGSSRSVGSGCTLVEADVTCAPPFPDCWKDAPGLTQCDGDFSGDGVGYNVTSTDFILLKAAYLTDYLSDPFGTGDDEYNPCADANRDGYVTSTDFIALKTYYLQTPPGNCNNDGSEKWPPLP